MSLHLLRLGLAASLASLVLAATAASTAAPAGGQDELVFVRGGDLYVVRTDGTGLRRLIGGPALEHSPTFSPDGGRLLFVRESRGGADLHVADADGRNARRLTRARGADYTPAWSPDGRRIAFASNRRGPFELYVMNADGSGVRLVAPTRRPAGGSFTPAWSPDGRRIAFSSTATTPENAEIYLVRPDGRGLTRLTRTRGDAETLGDDAWPTWSPDGRRIAFSSNRTGSGEIWIMNAAGTGQRRIAGLPLRDDWAPAFSPDGSRIAFHSLDARGRSALYLVRPDGTGLHRLGVAGEDPTWRP